MRLAVLGASGKTGRLVVELALQAGHEVVALVRDPKKLALASKGPKGLKVIVGEATDEAALRAVTAGADAVISTLGQTKTSAKDLLTQTAPRLIHAMKNNGVRRIVTLIGAGVRDPEDPPDSFGRKVMISLMRLLVPHVLKDAAEHAEIIRKSGLDFVIVRPPRLTDGPKTGQINAGFRPLGPGHHISRADLAEFLLNQAVSPTFSGRGPMVAAS